MSNKGEDHLENIFRLFVHRNSFVRLRSNLWDQELVATKKATLHYLIAVTLRLYIFGNLVQYYGKFCQNFADFQYQYD